MQTTKILTFAQQVHEKLCTAGYTHTIESVEESLFLGNGFDCIEIGIPLDRLYSFAWRLQGQWLLTAVERCLNELESW